MRLITLRLVQLLLSIYVSFYATATSVGDLSRKLPGRSMKAQLFEVVVVLVVKKKFAQEILKLHDL